MSGSMSCSELRRTAEARDFLPAGSGKSPDVIRALILLSEPPSPIELSPLLPRARFFQARGFLPNEPFPALDCPAKAGFFVLGPCAPHALTVPAGAITSVLLSEDGPCQTTIRKLTA